MSSLVNIHLIKNARREMLFLTPQKTGNVVLNHIFSALYCKALKFPVIRRSFRLVHEAFEQYYEVHGALELQTRCHNFGVTEFKALTLFAEWPRWSTQTISWQKRVWSDILRKSVWVCPNNKCMLLLPGLSLVNWLLWWWLFVLIENLAATKFRRCVQPSWQSCGRWSSFIFSGSC